MDIVKRNIFSIICGVVAVVAMLVPVWPMGGYRDSLQAALKQRREVHDSLNALANKKRTVPVLTLRGNPVALDGFPNETVIARGQEAKVRLGEEARKVAKTAADLSAEDRELMVPNCLPSPSSPEQFRFRDVYKSFYDQLAQDLLKGAQPPSAEVIQKAKDALWSEKYAPQLANNASPGFEQDLRAQCDSESRRMAVQKAQDVAKQTKIYMEPNALDVNLTISQPNQSPPDAVTIWWAHVSYWVQRDIIKALIDANANAQNVTESTVKRLIRIQVNNSFATSASNSYTGRVSNNQYEVMNFSMLVDVDAENVPRFLGELTKNRFITVLQVNVASLDSAAATAAGYVYGDRPVVQLTLNCEELLMRSWMLKYMPPSIKQQ